MMKLELGLLETRILHLEAFQFRLRQFCLATWSLFLTVGLGLTSLATSAGGDVRVVAGSVGIPMLFGFLDAWYARAAQRFRNRFEEIGEYANLERSEIACPIEPLEVLDYSGSSPRTPLARYRTKMAVKVSRPIRMVFFGSQVFVSAGSVVALVVASGASPAYLGVPGLALSLIGVVIAVARSERAKMRREFGIPNTRLWRAT